MGQYSTDRQGFTLMEMIAVIMIAGILAAFALPRFTVFMEQTNSSMAKNYLLAIAAAQVKYYEDQSFQGNPVYCINTTGCGDTTVHLFKNLGLDHSSSDRFTYTCTNAAAPYKCTAQDSMLTLTLNVSAKGVTSIDCSLGANSPYCPYQ